MIFLCVRIHRKSSSYTCCPPDLQRPLQGLLEFADATGILADFVVGPQGRQLD